MHPKGQRLLRGAITAKEVKMLREALDSATLTMDGTQCCVDDVHQQAMKLYLDSWVARPIRRVLGNLEARHEKANRKEIVK